jgi:hypothetical protein
LGSRLLLELLVFVLEVVDEGWLTSGSLDAFFWFHEKLEMCNDGSMIRKVHVRHRAVPKLLQIGIAPPKHPITKGRNSLFFAGVKFGRPQIILIGWHKTNGPLLELPEKHVLVSVFRLWWCRVVFVERKHQIVNLKQIV